MVVVVVVVGLVVVVVVVVDFFLIPGAEILFLGFQQLSTLFSTLLFFLDGIVSFCKIV